MLGVAENQCLLELSYNRPLDYLPCFMILAASFDAPLVIMDEIYFDSPFFILVAPSVAPKGDWQKATVCSIGLSCWPSTWNLEIVTHLPMTLASMFVRLMWSSCWYLQLCADLHARVLIRWWIVHSRWYIAV